MAREQLQAIRYYKCRVIALVRSGWAWVVQDIADAIVDAWVAGWRMGQAHVEGMVPPGPFAREFAEGVVEALSDELPEVSVERMEAYARELATAWEAGRVQGMNGRV